LGDPVRIIRPTNPMVYDRAKRLLVERDSRSTITHPEL
jgi:hypothetical protein